MVLGSRAASCHFCLFYFYWGLQQLLLMFKILSSTMLNVTTPIPWPSHPQCRCSTEEMTSPRFLFQHGLSPRPTANLLLHSAVRLQAQQKPSLQIYSLPISHGPVPAAGRSQSKPLANTCLSNGNCISAALQILPTCASSHWKSHKSVCQTQGNKKLLILTPFSRLGVLVNPYPLGITGNQSRKNSQKGEFGLPSQQDLTHPRE